MVKHSTNINKTNNHLSPQSQGIQKKYHDMVLMSSIKLHQFQSIKKTYYSMKQRQVIAMHYAFQLTIERA